MKLLKKIILSLPEYLLIAAVLFYWMSAGQPINYIAIGLIIAIVLQIIFKNKMVGIAIPFLLIITSLYMILALISEVREFPSFNAEAKTLLLFGLTYFLTTMLVSVIMIYKYAILPSKQRSS
ncbi:hypothetical protein [Psychroserpens sp.]|uniref:hypothetical protein n=1 Tax=Psychroserpens sp. TaxID=2020870 RepID=UPI002B273A29|nr:hypothetical protein [Psychroserpens sp.]